MNFMRWIVGLNLMLLVGTCWAQRPPEVIPSSRNERVQLFYDRSSIPGDQHLLLARTIIAHSYDERDNFGRVYLTCNSNDDSASGRCPTSDTGEAAGDGSLISLRFVERRSGLRTELNVKGHLLRIFKTWDCSRDFWSRTLVPLWTSTEAICIADGSVGTGGELMLESSELAKLVAGRWDATLEMTLRSHPAGGELATYKFAFDLTITDRDRANIYFPASDNITPLVNLNVAYLPVPSPPHVEGGTSLDMCLYDGLGSQIPYLEVTIRDDGKDAPGRAPGMHSVWHHAGGRGDDSRLDYSITLDYGGVPLKMDNNVTQRLLGIDTTQLRLVVLPGMSQPVYCVPAPLKLTVPRVLASSKLAGYYEGRMIIEMVVPSSTP